MCKQSHFGNALDHSLTLYENNQQNRKKKFQYLKKLVQVEGNKPKGYRKSCQDTYYLCNSDKKSSRNSLKEKIEKNHFHSCNINLHDYGHEIFHSATLYKLVISSSFVILSVILASFVIISFDLYIVQ